jgi:hypothetical protein
VRGRKLGVATDRMHGTDAWSRVEPVHLLFPRFFAVEVTLYVRFSTTAYLEGGDVRISYDVS